MLRQTKKLDALVGSLIPKLPQDKKVLIYGAYGYSGELICRIIKQYEKDLLPVFLFGGRSQDKLDEFATKYNFPKSSLRCFDVSKHFDHHLNQVSVVLNCAGPFAHTYSPMVQACLRVGASYLDITGEYPVLEAIHTNAAWNEMAAKKNVYLVPAIAFDVVPSDCLIRKTCTEFEKQFKQVPEKIEVAMRAMGQASHGTMKTMVLGLGNGSHSRVNGKIASISSFQTRQFEFKNHTDTCVMVPWGDISTGYHSTKIPNIFVYFANFAPPQPALFFLQLYIVQLSMWFFFKLPFVVPFLQYLVEKLLPKGPSDEQLEKAPSCEMIAIATGSNNKQIKTRLVCLPGYVLTAHSGLVTALKVLVGDVQGKPGALTPSQAFGEDYILEFDESEYSVL